MSRDSLPADEAFAVLADETRIAILRALFDDPTEPMTFSELREAVGVRDSGQFNYHLGKLIGRFVRKTDEGYEIRLAGWKVIGAILSGTYTESGNHDPVAFDHPCPECGGTVVATYEDERMRIACRNCGEQFSSAGIPPGAIAGFDREELPARFDQLMHGLVEQAKRGICVSCNGRMDAAVVTEPDPKIGVDAERLPMISYRCRRCPEVVTASFASAMLDHPAVVSFHWERGIDLRTAPTWTIGWLARNDAVVESEEPVRVRLTVAFEDDALELLVDGELNVVETARSA